VSGLRRFAVPAAAAPAPPATTVAGAVGIPQPREADGAEKCELCGIRIFPGHAHVADLQQRGIKCACRPCALLFTQRGAAGGRYRTVPDRYRYASSFAMSAAQWDELQIPVGVAFFFENSDQAHWVACYPSPAGATESLLTLETWEEVLGGNPGFEDLEPDVEAVLIRRTGTSLEGDFEAYLVPIDSCYQLVGLVRMYWKGFDGGEEVWQELGKFFDWLRSQDKSIRGQVIPPRPTPAGGGNG